MLKNTDMETILDDLDLTDILSLETLLSKYYGLGPDQTIKTRWVNWVIGSAWLTHTKNICVDSLCWMSQEKPELEKMAKKVQTAEYERIIEQRIINHEDRRRERRKILHQLCVAHCQRLQVERQQEEAEEAKQEEDAAPIPHATQRTEDYITRFGRVSKPPNRF